MDNKYNSAKIEDLVEEYADMIFRIALHHVKSKADAEDILQGVLIKLIEKAPEFTSCSHEKAWIIRVTINLCKDYYRSPWYKKVIPINEAYIVKDEVTKEDNILSYVKKLPANQRNAIYLYYYEDMSVAEIGKVLGVKYNTVMSWLHRGRQKLKNLMKGEVECLKINTNQK